MTFIVLLIALLIERFFDWSHIRHFNTYFSYQHWIANKLPGQSPLIIAVAIILPVLIIVGLIKLLLGGLLYGLVGLIFSLIVLLYCLGPKNLWVDSFACLHPLSQGIDNAKNELGQLFNVKEMNDRQQLHKQLLSSIFIEANTRIFAVIFWFALLGPVGAVLYRLVSFKSDTLTTEAPVFNAVGEKINTLQRILDFLPARLFTFFFALGGHFAKVFPFWSKHAVQGWSYNEVLLAETGLIAIGNEEVGKIPEDGSAEKNAISLLDRSLVIFLVLIALLGLLI